MSENIQHTSEFTPAQMELISAAREFVQRPGSILIRYPEGSSWQDSLMWLRVGRTADDGAVIVRISQYLPPDLSYDSEGYSWDEHIRAELLSKNGEHTDAYAVRRASGAMEWFPNHCGKVDEYFQESWRRTGGANATNTISDHDFEMTDEQLKTLTAAITSPETLTLPEATKAARDYYLRVYGQQPRKADESARLTGRGTLVRFIAKCLDL